MRASFASPVVALVLALGASLGSPVAAAGAPAAAPSDAASGPADERVGADGGLGTIAGRQEGAWRYLAAADLARALGALVESRDGVLTLRTTVGVLTAFAGSPDALWQARGAPAAEEVAAAAPVLVEDGGWYLPEDLVGVLGVRVDADRVLLPDGGVRALVLPRPAPPGPSGRSELVELGPAVEALRLYADAPAGRDTVSMLALDLGLVALAFPEQREALDPLLRDLAADKVLLLIVTSLERAAWDPAVYVAQDGVELLLRAPLAVQVLEGDPEAVTPGAPVVAVAFLPTTFDLRRPLQIRWAGASGSLTLRR